MSSLGASRSRQFGDGIGSAMLTFEKLRRELRWEDLREAVKWGWGELADWKASVSQQQCLTHIRSHSELSQWVQTRKWDNIWPLRLGKAIMEKLTERLETSRRSSGSKIDSWIKITDNLQVTYNPIKSHSSQTWLWKIVQICKGLKLNLFYLFHYAIKMLHQIKEDNQMAWA